MTDIIERNNADNLRRMKKWIKKCFREDLIYPEVFIEEMDVIISAAKELKRERLLEFLRECGDIDG